MLRISKILKMAKKYCKCRKNPEKVEKILKRSKNPENVEKS
jgi:hypothetical protein